MPILLKLPSVLYKKVTQEPETVDRGDKSLFVSPSGTNDNARFRAQRTNLGGGFLGQPRTSWHFFCNT
jgi:hypothetical protein